MKITMYDMGFGDAHILEEDDNDKQFNEKMLVDCGSNNPRNAAKTVNNSLNLIEKSLEDCYASFLLTHFHRDHYNQLDNLKNVSFNKIYFSNIYSDEPTVYKMAYQLLIYDKHSVYWNSVINIIKLFPQLSKMLKTGGMVIVLSKGSKFILNGDTYEVFSPSLFQNKFFVPYIFKNEYIGNLVENVASNIFKIGSSITNYSEKIRSNKTVELYVETINNINNIISKVLNEIELIVDKTKYVLDEETKEELKKKIRYIDKHKFNIIFGLSHKNDKKHFRLLMCGDETKKDLEDIIIKNNINSIDVMKAPHHGTPNYASTFALKYVKHALIPYSYPENKCKSYIISSIYYDTPYNNNHQPKHSEKY